MRFPLQQLFSSTLIGLDIHSEEIRLIQFKKSRQTFILQHLAHKSLSPDIFHEGKVKRFDLLSTALLDLVQELNLKKTAVALSIPANLVSMQHIQVPLGLTTAEIEAEIYTHVYRDLPGRGEALCIDFQCISSPLATEMEVFFTATRQEYLSRYIDCVELTGLKVKSVEVDLTAIIRVVNFALQWEVTVGEVNAIVYIANKVVTLIIFDAKTIIFHQQWDKQENINLLQQFKNKLQIWQASSRKISLRKIAVCGAIVALSQSEKNEFKEFQFFNPDLFAKLNIAPQMDFLLACGLAMLETPKW